MNKAMQIDTDSLLASPEWHLFNFMVREREFKFRAMDEQDYRSSVFLDNRIENPRQQEFTLGLKETLKLFLASWPPPAPISWIFHVGHCGSTLLSRALDYSDMVLPLREPETLNFLSEVRRELGQPICLFSEEAFEQLRNTAVVALSRTFRPGQRPIVKATSTCNNLVGTLLESAPASRAVLLCHSLERHITGRFRTPGGTKDLIAQARKRMLDWLAIPGTPELHNSRLAPEQLAALAWLTSMNHLLEAHRRRPEKTLLVNFDDFLGNPDQQLPAIAEFLGLAVVPDQLRAHYEQVSVHYSKVPGTPFTASDRRRFHDLIRQKESERITRGMAWAEKLVRAVPALEPVGGYLE